MSTMPTVLVPLDGTAAGAVALPIATRLAALAGTALKILHVARRPPPLGRVLDRVGIDPHLLGSTIVEEAAGSPARSILRTAEASDTAFIVLSTQVAASPEKELGYTAREVLRRASCPVVLVRPAFGFQPWRLKEILIPVDGTPTTAAALRPTAEIARRASATLFILHVAAPARARAEHGTLRAPCYVDQPQHEWPAWNRELVERTACLAHIPVHLCRRVCVGTGDPGREIIRFATRHEVDLIVLAWHGRLDHHRALAARTLLENAPCPLLIFRIPGDSS